MLGSCPGSLPASQEHMRQATSSLWVMFGNLKTINGCVKIRMVRGIWWVMDKDI